MKAENVRTRNPLCRWLGVPALAAVLLTRRWRQRLAGALVGLLVAVFSCGAQAKLAGKSEFQAFMDLSTGVNQHTISFAGTGTPVVTTGTAGSTAVGGMNIVHDATGMPYAKGNIKVPAPSGSGAATALVKSAKFANVGRALFRFGVSFLGPVGIGLSIYDTLKSMNPPWDMDNPTANTTHAILKPVSNHSCALTATEQSAYDTWLAAHSPPRTAQTTYGSGSCSFNGVWFNPACACVVTDVFQVKSDTVTINYTPATEDEFASAIDTTPSWSNGNIDRAIADAVNAGQQITVPDPADQPSSVSCTDQTIPGSAVTKTNSDGSTYTEQVDWVATCSGAVIGYLKKSNVTSTSSTGTVTTSTTTTTGEPDPNKTNDCQSGDTTAKCAKLDVPTGDVPTTTKTVSWAEKSLGFGAGSCPPPYGWHDSLGNHAIDLAPLCDKITTIVKPIILAFALLTAYFIVAGIKSSES